MRTLFVLSLFFVAPLVYAHLPVVVSPQHVEDIMLIDRPEVSWAYYGELTGFPHTYEIRAQEGFQLYTHILEPDIAGVKQNHAGLIVRNRDNGRGVEEVARLEPSSASWESFYEFAGGDSYLSGPEYEAEVGSGVYRIEVSNAVNQGKYVLVVGQIEDFSGVGYFETLGRILEVKHFFGKPPITMVVSPFVFVPLIVVALFALVGRWYYKKKYHG